MKIKHLPFLFGIFGLSIACNNSTTNDSEIIDNKIPIIDQNYTPTPFRINQIGYYPMSVKRFVVTNMHDDLFQIVSDDNQVVYGGYLEYKGVWDKSGEEIKIGDFSEYNLCGKYFIKIGDWQSEPFIISKDLYFSPFNASLKSYYFQRTSEELLPEYAERWARPLGHRDDHCLFHPSAKISNESKSSAGGWYDAGDYAKYTVNAGFTIGMLLAAYEAFPNQFPDNQTNIPESGNDISDLLDEIRVELDWLLSMQDDDGGCFVKLTTRNWAGMIMPHFDNETRYFVGKSTAATLNFAAATAKASRAFEKVDAKYSSQLLSAARSAWNWANVNNNILYIKTDSIHSGEYPDTDLHEEFLWAASELYLATNDTIFKKYVMANKSNVNVKEGDSWRIFNETLGYMALLNQPQMLSSDERRDLQISLVACADSLLENTKRIPYEIPLDKFVWGSNNDILDFAIVMAEAFRLTKNRQFLDAVIKSTDYIFGKNATAYSFVTGFGSRSPLFIHHRPSISDGITAPVPGLLCGGPNASRDDASNHHGKVFYADTLPANSYTDNWESWASNEVAINWNASLVYILAFIRDCEQFLNSESYL